MPFVAIFVENSILIKHDQAELTSFECFSKDCRLGCICGLWVTVLLTFVRLLHLRCTLQLEGMLAITCLWTLLLWIMFFHLVILWYHPRSTQDPKLLKHRIYYSSCLSTQRYLKKQKFYCLLSTNRASRQTEGKFVNDMQEQSWATRRFQPLSMKDNFFPNIIKQKALHN